MPDLPSALAHLTFATTEALQTECCSVYLADHQAQEFVLMATHGLNKDYVGKFRMHFSEGLVGLIGQREEPLNLAVAAEHPRFKHAPEVGEDVFSAFMGVPIIHRRKVIGVICVQQAQVRSFNDDEEALLATLSAQLAPVLSQSAETAFALRSASAVANKQLRGLAQSSGVAIGQVQVIQNKADLASVKPRKVYRSQAEIDMFYQAVRQAKQRYLDMQQKLADVLSDDALAVFDIYLQLLDASSLGHKVEQQIRDGYCAKSGLKLVIDNLVQQFEHMQDEYIRQKSRDIRDLGNEVLNIMLRPEEQIQYWHEPAILAAEEVTVAILGRIPKDKLLGIISVKGSQTSHTSIIAKALGIPAVLGLESLNLMSLDDMTIVVDGYSGNVLLNPSAHLIKQYVRLKQSESQLVEQMMKVAELPAKTKDGVALELLCNAGFEIELSPLAQKLAQGIGLYRTESRFMLHSGFPSETEQMQWYHSLLSQNPQAPVYIRTLDIGGDKQLPYFEINEENPFLGWRGMRLTLDQPEIFLVQVRALLRANMQLGNLKIMLPMLTDTEELNEALRLINQAYFELNDEFPGHIAKPAIGAVIEVPSSVYLLEHWAEKLDFISVGSNDLTQYLLAVDRNNPRVASLYDSLHPAVLRVLKTIIDTCQAKQLPASLCGELAADPMGALLLVAMGYRSLSMSEPALLRVKWLIRQIDAQALPPLLAQCLQCHTAGEVRSVMTEFMRKNKLGRLLSQRH